MHNFLISLIVFFIAAFTLAAILFPVSQTSDYEERVNEKHCDDPSHPNFDEHFCRIEDPNTRQMMLHEEQMVKDGVIPADDNFDYSKINDLDLSKEGCDCPEKSEDEDPHIRWVRMQCEEQCERQSKPPEMDGVDLGEPIPEDQCCGEIEDPAVRWKRLKEETKKNPPKCDTCVEPDEKMLKEDALAKYKYKQCLRICVE